MRTRRPVMQTVLALNIETGNPPMGALPGDPHGFGDMSDRHALFTDPFYEQTTAMQRQSSVTVRHEDLRLVKTAISTAPEVFASRQPVTNVPAEYN
jgi:hypothetical protein